MTWIIRGLLWLAGFLALSRIVTLRTAGSSSTTKDGDLPSISVVIPARNEAGSLPALLESLSQQTVKPHEVIVVDDDSSDDTRLAAKDHGADVVLSEMPGSGWTGKNHACWVGAKRSTGDLICFIDADVTMGTHGLEALAAASAARGGLVTVVPHHETRRAYEGFSAFFNLVAAMGTGAFTPIGSKKGHEIASGPAMICSRTDYEAAGGHQAVADCVVDDVELGRAFEGAGLPVSCYFGGTDISYRMYPGGFRQLLEGWSKNIAQGATRARPLPFVLVTAWVTGALTASLLAVNVVIGLASAGLPSSDLLAACIYYALFAGQIWYFERRLGRFPVWSAAAFPVAVGFFVGVFALSAVLAFAFHRVRWKGRTIRT